VVGIKSTMDFNRTKYNNLIDSRNNILAIRLSLKMGIICVDCRQEKEGREIIKSWQVGSKREFRCLCNKCYEKRNKQNTPKP